MRTQKKPIPLPIGPRGIRWALQSKLGDSLKTQWAKDGFVVIPGVFKGDQIDRCNAIVEKVRSEVDDGKDEQGFGDRIGQLHQREPDLLEMASSPQILEFLRWSFGEDPLLMGSLQFQKGTQQNAHIDAIFFWPEPSYAMAGVWVALEDIHEDSGPLFYIPGSHRWPFVRSEHLARKYPELAKRRDAAKRGELTAEERSAVVNELGVAWTDEIPPLERQHQGRRVPICLKAGDVVIWHSLLAHGGSARNDSMRSRKSAVFHYFGKTAKLYTFDEFMLYDSNEIRSLPPTVTPVKRHMGVEYMRFPQFVTYCGGKEIVHPLE